MGVSIIVAVDSDGVIGSTNSINNKLLWDIPEDLIRFKELTMDNFIVGGRVTLESIGKILLRRETIMLSNTKSTLFNKPVHVIGDLNDLKILHTDREFFIIGGASVYKQALDLGIVDTIYLTRIYNRYNGDIYFPLNNPDPAEWEKVDTSEHIYSEEEDCFFKFITYKSRAK